MQVDTQEQVSRNFAFLVISGCLLAMLGVIVMGAPLATGMAVEMIIGVMILTRATMQLYYGFKVRHWGHRFGSYIGMGSIFMALVSIAVGVVLIMSPIAGLRLITLLLAMYLVISGGCELLHAIELSAARGWGFTALSGVFSVLLGILVWRQWPLAGQWAVGVMVGAGFIASGAALAMLGIEGRAQLAAVARPQPVGST